MPITRLQQNAVFGPAAGDPAMRPAAAAPGTNVRPGSAVPAVAIATRLTEAVKPRGGVPGAGIGGARYAYPSPRALLRAAPTSRGVLGAVAAKPFFDAPPVYVDPQALAKVRPMPVYAVAGVGTRVMAAAPPPNTISAVQVLAQPPGLIL